MYSKFIQQIDLGTRYEEFWSKNELTYPYLSASGVEYLAEQLGDNFEAVTPSSAPTIHYNSNSTVAFTGLSDVKMLRKTDWIEDLGILFIHSNTSTTALGVVYFIVIYRGKELVAVSNDGSSTAACTARSMDVIQSDSNTCMMAGGKLNNSTAAGRKLILCKTTSNKNIILITGYNSNDYYIDCDTGTRIGVSTEIINPSKYVNSKLLLIPAIPDTTEEIELSNIYIGVNYYTTESGVYTVDNKYYSTLGINNASYAESVYIDTTDV